LIIYFRRGILLDKREREREGVVLFLVSARRVRVGRGGILYNIVDDSEVGPLSLKTEEFTLKK
jgi:hypothetical protein